MTSAARPKAPAGLRPFLPADAPLLAEIFRASVAELTSDDYSEAQQAAWTAAADDEDAFAARLAGELTLVAIVDGAPVGFAALKGADEIDMLYVHPAVVGHGIGAQLADALEKLAAARGATRVSADASDSALGFFEHRGFAPQRRNTVPLADEWLANTTVQKQLSAAKGSASGSEPGAKPGTKPRSTP
jgi:putative acetyltransferase